MKAVSTISAPFDVKHVTRLFEGGLEAILRDGEADVNLGGRPFRIRRAFVDDLEKQDQGERIRNLRRPLLILHAPLDAQVGIENATDIFLAAKHPKSFVSLDNADHLIVRQADAEYAAQVIAAWASRYVGEPVPLRSSGQPGEVLVQETGEGNFEVEVVAGNARFIADEPPEVGGNGSGPTPYDLLSAALAACTSMTLRLYARHKGLTLGRISVAAAHAKKPRDQFTRNISVDGPVTPEMRAKLLEIADKCPVHRTLTGTATITSSITDPDTPVVPSETPMQHAIDADQILEGS